MDSSDDDMESVRRLPEESVDDSAIEDELPRRYFVKCHKRTAATVFSILILIVAIILVVVLSSKPSQQTGLEHAVDIAAPKNDDTDIVLVQGYDEDYPDDIIYDQGYQAAEPLEVEITDGTAISEASGEILDEVIVEVQAADFESTLSNFITSSSRISKALDGQCTNPGEGLFYLQLNTDNYPWENRWEFKESNTGAVLMAGPPTGKNYAKLTTYIGSMCVTAGEYTIELFDKSGDGICCQYGNGTLIVKVNGKTVVSTGDTDFTAFKKTFVVSSAASATPTKKPVANPTTTKKPTSKPAAATPTGQNSVVVQVKTDKFGNETGYTFTNVDDGTVLVKRRAGSLKADMLYENKFLVEDDNGLTDATYSFTLNDKSQGLLFPAGYAIKVNDVEILHANKAQTYLIDVGYTPSMTDSDKLWLDAHNTRRKAFYEKEGLSDKPLVWSLELAESASKAVDAMLSSCKPVLELNLQDGENISSRTANAERNEGADVVLTRWVDNKIDATYPINQSMTQVLWRATRYLGCSNKKIERDNGSICYVSVCRYARAGNCQIKNGDWKTPTLAERSLCGRACPAKCY